MPYTIEDLPELEKWLAKAIEKSKLATERDWHKDYHGNSEKKEVARLTKLIKLVEHGLYVEDYSPGLVLIGGKFVVSLTNNKWRVVNRNVWYRHKNDLDHFVSNYIKDSNP
jgi:hypothetical protein